MDESGIEARNRQSSCEETLRVHFKITTFRKGLFIHHQLSRKKIPCPLTQRYSFVSGCNVLTAGTVIDDLIKKEGDATMG